MQADDDGSIYGLKMIDDEDEIVFYKMFKKRGNGKWKVLDIHEDQTIVGFSVNTTEEGRLISKLSFNISTISTCTKVDRS